MDDAGAANPLCCSMLLVTQIYIIWTHSNYKKSFVLGLMNKRSINDTISYHVINDKNIDDYIQSRITE